jgi:parallel beta-helix repeat protein
MKTCNTLESRLRHPPDAGLKEAAAARVDICGMVPEEHSMASLPAEADRRRSPRRDQRWRQHVAMFWGLCLLCAQGAAGAIFSYAPNVNTIYVSGGGSATLSNIKAALPGAPLEMVDPTSQIWLLRANLVLQNGSTLVLHGSAAGGDVNELRLLSINSVTPCDCAVSITADWGNLDINGAQITSWDTVGGAPNMNTLGFGRASILALSSLSTNGVTAQNSRMDITNGEICNLGGGTNSDYYGLVWKVSGVNPNPATDTNGVQVFGNVVNSQLHNNYIGAYTVGAYGMQWLNNQFYNNAKYGMDLQDFSDNALIQGNTFSNNLDQPVLFSDSSGNMLATNTFTGTSGTLRFEGGQSNWLDGNILPSAMTLVTESDANGPGQTYVKNQSYLIVELDTNSTTTFEDAGGLIYQPTQGGVLTALSTAGSVLDLTPAGVGSFTVVTARNFFASAAPGTAYLNQLIWNPPAKVQWTLTPGSAGQTLVFTVGNLALGANYVVMRGNVALANLTPTATAGGLGQIQFGDAPGSTSPVVYSIAEGAAVAQLAPLAPQLFMQPAAGPTSGANGLAIQWANGTLQSTTNLAAPYWQNVPTTNGQTSIWINPALPCQFFRVVAP